MALTRRDTLRGATAAVGFAAFGGMVHWLERMNTGTYPAIERPYAKTVGILRPPGALAEPDFLAACIRCNRCQDACEPGAIQFYTEKDGLLLHTPYVDPAKAGCTLCNKCGPICPTNALAPFDDKSDVDMGSVELQENLCLSFKAKWLRQKQEILVQAGREPTEVDALVERRGPCGECHMFCPLRNKAIKLEPGRFLAPIVFTEHCVGCGMCEEICRVVVRGEPAIRVVRTRKSVTVGDAA